MRRILVIGKTLICPLLLLLLLLLLLRPPLASGLSLRAYMYTSWACSFLVRVHFLYVYIELLVTLRLFTFEVRAAEARPLPAESYLPTFHV